MAAGPFDAGSGKARAGSLIPRRSHATGIDALTPRERQVAELSARGMTDAQIAHKLVISVKTVERHMGHIFDKLDVAARGEIAAVLRVS